jgi:glycosyltransferase involved in cell wall biosynthesis
VGWPERVALVHDRLDQNGGAERVLWAVHEIFPSAPIFTAMWNREMVPQFEVADVRTSWMQALPGIGRAPRLYAGLYPLAFAPLPLKSFDLVISLTSSFAKGVRTRPDAVHLCYCHSPSNFIWRPDVYFTSPAKRALSRPLRGWLKRWEVWAGRQPDVYVANGAAVKARIHRYYGALARILHPPVDDIWFSVERKPEDFYLVVGRLVEQKRLDLAIAASNQLGFPLVVAGEGRRLQEFRRHAGPQVSFLGHVDDQELAQLYGRARAVLVPAEEDFGLVPIEAQAAGAPVVAFDRGGARETVQHGITGIRYAPQTAEALAGAIRELDGLDLDPGQIRDHARTFSKANFERGLLDTIGELAPTTSRGGAVEAAWQS